MRFSNRDRHGYSADDRTSESPRTIYAVWKTGPRKYEFGSVEDLEEDPSRCPTGTFEILIGLAAFMEWARKFYRFEVKTISEAEIARIADRFTKWDT